MEASEPKWINPVLNIIGVNSIGSEASISFTILVILKEYKNDNQNNENQNLQIHRYKL